MHVRMVRFDGVTSSSRVGETVVVLSRIGHGDGRVIVKLNIVVRVHAYNCKLYA